MESIASWVRSRKAFLILVFLSGQFLSLSMGLVDSTSPRPWRFMFRADTWGERRGGSALVTGGAADRAVRTVGGFRGGATPGPFGLVSTFLSAVSEGTCVDGWSVVATLGGVLIRSTLGGWAALRRGCGPTGDTESKFARDNVGFGARR